MFLLSSSFLRGEKEFLSQPQPSLHYKGQEPHPVLSKATLQSTSLFYQNVAQNLVLSAWLQIDIYSNIMLVIDYYLTDHYCWYLYCGKFHITKKLPFISINGGNEAHAWEKLWKHDIGDAKFPSEVSPLDFWPIVYCVTSNEVIQVNTVNNHIDELIFLHLMI